MNILLVDGLPEEYNGIPLSTDFRNMINVDLIFSEDDELSDHEKAYAALLQLYEIIPSDINTAVDGLKWFYSRGETEPGIEEDKYKAKKQDKPYSFSQDAGMIYAAFYATYGVDFTEIEIDDDGNEYPLYMHWWQFMTLFENLPENTLIKRVMYWRTADLDGLQKHEKEYIKKMRKIYALKKFNKAPLSVEEIDRQTKDRVARRYEEAQKMLEKSQQ